MLVINFRYHVVSLTAVFLALAIGLVRRHRGAQRRRSPTSCSDQVTGAAASRTRSTATGSTTCEDDVASREAFATAIAPVLLDNGSPADRVLLVSMPSGTRLRRRGARTCSPPPTPRSSGRVEIKDKFTDPANNDELLDLARPGRCRPASPVSLPTNSDGVETSAALLAGGAAGPQPGR